MVMMIIIIIISWDHKSLFMILGFIALLDNYESEGGHGEVVTQHEIRENQCFIDAIYETEPMKIAHKYLAEKGLMPGDRPGFKKALYNLWFKLYRRTKGVRYNAFNRINRKLVFSWNELAVCCNFRHEYIFTTMCNIISLCSSHWEKTIFVVVVVVLGSWTRQPLSMFLSVRHETKEMWLVSIIGYSSTCKKNVAWLTIEAFFHPEG